MVGGEHLRHCFTRHDLAERERRRVGRPVIHQEAHGGVERQVLHPKEQLPGSRGRERGVFQAEVGHVRCALRARGEDDVACHSERHIDTSTQMLRAGCPRRLPKSHRAKRALRRPVCWTHRYTHGKHEACSPGQRYRIMRLCAAPMLPCPRICPMQRGSRPWRMPCSSMGAGSPVLAVNALSTALDGITPYLALMTSTVLCKASTSKSMK